MSQDRRIRAASSARANCACSACTPAWPCSGTRREAIRKVYFEKERLGVLREVIAHCVANRIGYRILPGEALEKLTKSQHHEGVCFEVLRAPLQSLDDALAAVRPDASAWFAWLDGSAIRTIWARCCAPPPTSDARA
jgi:hypothetical protein